MADSKVINVEIRWLEKLAFQAEPEHYAVNMDVKPPLGKDSGPSPKQMLLMSICGCTGMDVAALIGKYKQPLESFSIHAQASMVEEHPMVFKEVILIYRLVGQADPEKIKDAVRLSMTKYCGVSAMMSKACPIKYKIELNGNVIGEGQADFGV